MSKETADILRAARKKIELPERWIKNNLGKDAKGNYILFAYKCKTAVCFCGYGAVFAVFSDASDDLWRFSEPATDALDYASGITDFPLWQDKRRTTHADVLAAFDRAIAAEDVTP